MKSDRRPSDLFPEIVAFITLVTGISVLVGWAFDITVLKSIYLGWVSMKANTALCFVLFGVAFGLHTLRQAESGQEPAVLISRVFQLSVLIPGLIGLLTLLEYAMGRNLGIDQLLFKEPIGTAVTSHPGRMSPVTALCFVLLAIALTHVNSRIKTSAKLLTAALSGLIVTTTGLVGILSYISSTFQAQGWFSLTKIAIHTAALLFISGLVVIQISWRMSKSKWSLSKSSTLGFALGMLIMFGIGSNTSLLQIWLSESKSKIAYSESIVSDTQAILIEMIDAQANARGYISTGNARFMNDFLKAKQNCYIKLAALSKFTADSTSQQVNIEELSRLVNDDLQWLQRMVEPEFSTRYATERLRMLLHGEDLLDAIRTAMEKIETEHIHDVARFNDQANEVQVYSNLVIAGGTILGLLIFLITMLRLNTVESRQNALLANNLRLTNLYAALTQCNQAIVRCTSDDELFKEICRITVEFGKMKLAWIGITDPESGLLNRVACSGTAMDYLKDLQVSVNPDLPESHGPTGTAIRENRPYWCENFQTDPATIPWRERAQRHGVGGAASLPLSRNGKVFGALIVYTDGSYKFDQSIKDLLVEMADDIGFAINNYANENQLRIASIAFESHEGMLIADATTRIQSVNQALTRITGYSTEDVIGKKPSILSSGRQDASFYFSMWQSIRTTGGWQGKIWNKRKNGEVFPALLSINCVKDKNGIVTHYVGALADITENEKTLEALRLASINLELANQQVNEERALLAQRVLERTVQLMMANRAKDSFLATMSHEIRTPLGGLLGMLELLGLSQLNANQKVMVQTARKSGKGLLRILNDILDWSKIEAGKLELVPSPATISDTIKGVVSTYSVLASEKGIQILVEIDPQLSNAHIFDTLRVSQILNNFTSNAIKFTERGNIVIRANLVAQQLGHEEVQFSVKDSGVGISPELHQRIFQQFEQASAETARMYGGTGLGLAICLKLAEMMGGRLSVESVSGLGATFSFFVSFPVANQAAQLKIQHSSQDEDQTGWPDISRLGSPDSPYTILIVDDHPVNRMLLKQQLEVLGIHTESAANGSSALPLWLNGHFDLIITDCHMPEIDGYELTRRIREAEQQTATRHIPIIAWTANVLAEEADRCHAAGMNDLLTKPTELAELRKKLLKWLPKASESSTGKYPAYVPSESAIETAIDFNILKKFAVSRPAQVEMLRIFLTQNRIDMGNLRAILKDGDPTEVAQMAHRIKGASRMVGAKELEEICSTIETACKQNDMPAMQTNVAKLDETMVRIETAILRFTDG